MGKKGKKKHKGRQKELESRRRKNRRMENHPPCPPAAAAPHPISEEARLKALKGPEGMVPEPASTPASVNCPITPVEKAAGPDSIPGELNARRSRAWRTQAWVWYLLTFMAPLVVLFCVQLITVQDPEAVFQWFAAAPGAAAITYLTLLSCQMLFSALSGSLFWPVLAVALPVTILSLASYFKEAINGTPLLISDLAMAGRAGDIAGFLRPGMNIGDGTRTALGLLIALLLLTALFAHRPKTRHWGWYGRTVAGLSCVLVLAGVFNLEGVHAVLGGPGNEIQAERNERLGLLAGLYSGFLDSTVQEPDAYNENNMNALLVQAKRSAGEREAAAGAAPNVVLIMSESFCDPEDVLPGVTFIDDPIPNYHALAGTWPAGAFLSNTYAGGTGNVEMEVLTGIPIAFVGEGEDLTSLTDATAYDRAPSIVKVLREQGYATEFVHSYNDRLYNRADNLPRIGFEKLLFEDDFPEDAERNGPYLTDMALTDMIISEFEQRDKDKPLLLFGLSMENHQPYFSGKFPASSGLRISSKALDEDGLGAVDALIHGLNGADKALGALLDYFEECGEPVLVVFWGDHLPSLYMDDDESLYSMLGYTETGNTRAWRPEVLKKMHTTRYLVWNNYGAELEVPETMSATGMGTYILDWAGAKNPLFFDWVKLALEDMLLYRQRLFVAGDGTPSYLPPADAEHTVEAYRNIIYDILYGEGYIAEEMLALPERE